MKIRNLKIQAFRGAKHELELEFSQDHRSVVIFGENGTGKSTISDSIEWFVTNRVGHLWAEDCKDEAILNIFSSTKQCGVSIEFSDSTMKSSKFMQPGSKVVHSNKSKAFIDYLGQAAKERIILRHIDVSRFVTATKNEKREEIEKIIGYEAIKKFRDVIRQTKNKLDSASEYQTAKKLVEQASAELLHLTKSLISKEAQLFEYVNSRLSLHAIKTSVTDFKSYDFATSELKSQIGDPKRAEKRLLAQLLKTNSEKFGKEYAEFHSHKESFLNSYNDLLQDNMFKGELSVLDFLNRGSELLDTHWKKQQACPFCLSDFDLEVLRSKVKERINEIGERSKKYKDIKFELLRVIDQIGTLHKIAVDMNSQATNLLNESEKEFLSIIGIDFASTQQYLSEDFEFLQPISFENSFFAAMSRFAEKTCEIVSNSETIIAQTTFSDAENLKIEELQTLELVKRAFIQRTLNKRIVNKYQNQILTLGEVYDRFIIAQNKALQDVLNAISSDVDHYFSVLHPSGSIGEIRLKILGEQGIEFEYSFHGKSTYPPKKFLSESFLNSLGLSLFLASANLFNEQSRFLVLDDIVTSFDQNLRRRLIRLLNEEFSDWQLILLTHEEFLFRLMKRELPSNAWSFHQIKYDSENGSRLQHSHASQEAFIREKRKEADVSNDIRKFIESTLKEICFHLEAKVSFRFNDANENRMSDELLASLRRSVKEHKCEEVISSGLFSKLDGSIFVTNKASHDSSVDISDADIDEALTDVSTLRGMFECVKCRRFVSIEYQIPGQKQISCKCGNKSLSWST